MKQIISRLKNISMMLIWDVITAIALFVFAYFSLDRMPIYDVQSIGTLRCGAFRYYHVCY